jgi:hypothetical protein
MNIHPSRILPSRGPNVEDKSRINVGATVSLSVLICQLESSESSALRIAGPLARVYTETIRWESNV